MNHVITEEAAKAKARALRAGLAEMGMRLKHTQALELVARIEGETGWSALSAKQAVVQLPSGWRAPAVKMAVAHAPAPTHASTSLLEGRELVDPLPCNSSGDTRKRCLYDALRLSGVPQLLQHPVVELVQELGGFSASAERAPLPTGDERYADDATPCGTHGKTRLQVLADALSAIELDEERERAVIEEYRARGGLTAAFQRG